MNPTHQTYSELQQAYDHFNQVLFAGELPSCLLTLQREKRTYGYFSAKRFSNSDGILTDEIAMNPMYFAVVPLVETMQTLVHEMCQAPGRRDATLCNPSRLWPIRQVVLPVRRAGGIVYCPVGASGMDVDL